MKRQDQVAPQSGPGPSRAVGGPSMPHEALGKKSAESQEEAVRRGPPPGSCAAAGRGGEQWNGRRRRERPSQGKGDGIQPCAKQGPPQFVAQHCIGAAPREKPTRCASAAISRHEQRADCFFSAPTASPGRGAESSGTAGAEAGLYTWVEVRTLWDWDCGGTGCGSRSIKCATCA